MGWAPSTRSAIGGRWAVSLPGGLILALAFVVVSVVRHIGHESAVQAVGTSAVSAAAGLGVLALAHCTVLRHRAVTPTPIWVVGCVGAAAGAVAGLVYVALADAPLRIAAAFALQMAWAIPLIAFLLAIRAAYVEERRRLVAVQVDLESARMRKRAADTSLRGFGSNGAPALPLDGVLELDAVLAALDAGPAGRPDGSASMALRDAARNLVRPASHRLWSTAAVGRTRHRVSGILRSALRLAPLPTGPVAVVLLASLGSAAIGGRFGGWLRVGSGAAIAVVVALLYLMGNGLLRRVPHRMRAVVGAGTIGASALAASCITAGIGSATVTGVVGVGVFVLLVCVVGAVIESARATQDEMITEMRRYVTWAEVELAASRQMAERVNREAARYLHGTVQARLVTAAHAIDDAGHRGDEQGVAEAVASVRRALDVTVGDLDADTPAGIDELRRSVVREWQGLLGVRFAVDADGLTEHEVRVIDEVVRQALFNAVVHGGAAHADVCLAADGPGMITITVVDDGCGPQGGAAGLGSTRLDMLTDGDWTLRPADARRGAELRARIPRG